MGDKQSSETQIQMKINKQAILLKQDQNSSNTILVKLMAELENLVILLGYKEKNYFNYYATKGQNKQEIINQIVFQMVIFESSYKNLVKNNPKQNYEFPENLTYQNVVSLISIWKQFLNKDKSYSHLIKYYDSFLKILEGKRLDEYVKIEFANLDKDSKPTTKEDLKKALNAGAIATSVINEKNKEIEKNIIEKGEHKVNVVIGGKREDNKFYKAYEKTEENLKKLKKKLWKSFDNSIGYLEIYYNIHLDNRLKYAYSVKEEIKKDIFGKYEKYKDEFIQNNEDICNEYDYEFFKDKKDKVKKLEKDLEKWKNLIGSKSIKKELDNAINVFCHGKEDSIE